MFEKKESDHLKKVVFFDGMALGIVIGTLFALAACWAISNLKAELAQSWVSFGAVIATIFAAYLALKGNKETINHSRQQERERDRNSFLSARAMLPVILSELLLVSKSHMSAYMEGTENTVIEKEVLSERSFDILRECIRYGKPELRDYLFEIIASYQILLARFNVNEPQIGMRNTKLTAYDRKERSRAILEWLAFQKLVENLFEFARQDAEEIDRSVVFKKTLDSAEFLFFKDGSSLENIEEFRDQLIAVKEKQFLQVASADWRQVLNRLRTPR